MKYAKTDLFGQGSSTRSVRVRRSRQVLKPKKPPKPKVSKEEKEKKQQEKILKQQRKVINENKPLYHIEHHTYKDRTTIELWKKNPRFGYNNFVCYLEDASPLAVDEVIEKDILKSIEEAKKKKNKEELADDSDN